MERFVVGAYRDLCGCPQNEEGTAVMARADIWVDPICPWTWLTAQWLLEVERLRDISVTFHVMSLSVLNEGRAATAEDEETVRLGWGPVRVLTAASLTLGEPALRGLYVALATLIHNQQHKRLDRDLYAYALTAAGLPHTLANAAESPFYDEDVRSAHKTAFDPVSSELGCPIIHIGASSGAQVPFFGPVVSPCPRGEAAGRLWDGVVLAASADSFFEFKRARTRGPIFG